MVEQKVNVVFVEQFQVVGLSALKWSCKPQDDYHRGRGENQNEYLEHRFCREHHHRGEEDSSEEEH